MIIYHEQKRQMKLDIPPTTWYYLRTLQKENIQLRRDPNKCGCEVANNECNI